MEGKEKSHTIPPAIFLHSYNLQYPYRSALLTKTFSDLLSTSVLKLLISLCLQNL